MGRLTPSLAYPGSKSHKHSLVKAATAVLAAMLALWLFQSHGLLKLGLCKAKSAMTRRWILLSWTGLGILTC